MELLSNRSFVIWNLAVSSVAVLFLVWLIYLHQTSGSFSQELSFLPALNATLNGLSALSLLVGRYFISRKNRAMHRNSMVSALLFSALFLVSYVVYHFVHGDTKFMAEGIIRPIYFFVLISHIALSVVVLPLITGTFFFALTDRLEIHRKIVKFTFPLWLYVSVTGVLIFLLIKMFNP